MDFSGLLVIGILWLILKVMGAGKQKGRPTPRTTARRPPTPPSGRVDPTQQEGSMLEQLLRELERNLGQPGGTRPPAGGRLPTPQSGTTARPRVEWQDDEDAEDRETLETEPKVVSLETEVRRPQRPRSSQDEEAEEIVRRRIEAARARDRALTKADHAAFDAVIRQQPADHTAVRQLTPAQLRDAIVWREILGPPVSEREP